VVSFERATRFVREAFDDIAPRQSRDLAKGLLPSQGVGFLAGPSGSYKTFLALEWSLRIAQGVPILGHRTTPCAVVYIAAEAANGVRRRVAAWKRENGARGLPFELIGNAPDLRDREQVEDLIAELRIAAGAFAARRHRLGLVVIDTLAASMPGGDENAGSEMSAVLATLSYIATELGVLVLLVSHTGKDETRGMRGWSGQFAGADVVIMLTREPQDGGGEVRVGKVAKLKEGEDGERFAIGLKPVFLGVDDDGDAISSGVIVRPRRIKTHAAGRDR
jgi:putative DNA primase/helicase